MSVSGGRTARAACATIASTVARAAALAGLALLAGCTASMMALQRLSMPPGDADKTAARAVGSPVAISAVLGERNSVNGIDVSITWQNLSSSDTIKYCWFTAEFVNQVGDVVASDVGNIKTARLESTGPFPPKKTSWGGLTGWPAVFYHPNASSVRLRSVQCQYMSGAKTEEVNVASLPSATGLVIEKVR